MLRSLSNLLGANDVRAVSSSPAHCLFGNGRHPCHTACCAQAFDYYSTGSDTCFTVAENRRHFEHYKLLPRMLRDVSRIDLGCTLLGGCIALGYTLGCGSPPCPRSVREQRAYGVQTHAPLAQHHYA